MHGAMRRHGLVLYPLYWSGQEIVLSPRSLVDAVLVLHVRIIGFLLVSIDEVSTIPSLHLTSSIRNDVANLYTAIFGSIWVYAYTSGCSPIWDFDTPYIGRNKTIKSCVTQDEVAIACHTSG